MNNSQGENVDSQKPDAKIIQFPRSGKYPESALVEWIFNQFTLEEIKGFILHQFDADYFVNQKKFQRFVKLCKLVDDDKYTKEKIQLKTTHARKHSPISEHITFEYNEPFVAASFPRWDSKDK